MTSQAIFPWINQPKDSLKLYIERFLTNIFVQVWFNIILYVQKRLCGCYFLIIWNVYFWRIDLQWLLGLGTLQVIFLAVNGKPLRYWVLSESLGVNNNRRVKIPKKMPIPGTNLNKAEIYTIDWKASDEKNIQNPLKSAHGKCSL